MKNIDRIKDLCEKEGVIRIEIRSLGDKKDGWKFFFCMDGGNGYLEIWSPEALFACEATVYTICKTAKVVISNDKFSVLDDNDDYSENIGKVEAILNEWLSKEE